MTNALISAVVVFVAILVAARMPLIGGLIAMFPIKATAMLWSTSAPDAIRGVFIGAIGSALFVAVFYFWPSWRWSGVAATLLWVGAALALPKVIK